MGLEVFVRVFLVKKLEYRVSAIFEIFVLWMIKKEWSYKEKIIETDESNWKELWKKKGKEKMAPI